MSEQSFGRGALAAGGLAAILASACCLGPLVLVALGFSGAWIGNLTALEPYRPVFIGGALVALFLAYRRIYRPVAAGAGRRLRRAASEIRLQNDFLGRGGIGRGSRRLPLHSSAVQLKRAPS